LGAAAIRRSGPFLFLPSNQILEHPCVAWQVRVSIV